MLPDGFQPPSHDVNSASVDRSVERSVTPIQGRLSFILCMGLIFIASSVFPIIMLTSAQAPQDVAYRREVLPVTVQHGMRGAASTPGKSRIERLKERRQAAHPGAIPLKPAAPQPPSRPDNHVATYLGAGSVRSEEFLLYTMDSIVKGGGNAFVFEVKADRVYFATTAPMANELKLVSSTSVYDIDHVLQEAQKRGLYTIGRYVALQDAGLSGADPSTLVKNPKTGASMSPGWTDPANPTTLEYNKQIICELAKKGIGEINLDYIRFSTADFGNLKVYTGTQKADRLETFIKMAHDTIQECGPGTKLGISTFAILGWDYDNNVETLGQDVKRLAPLVDIISPMAYPATFTSPEYYVQGRNPRSRMYWLVYHTLTGYKELLGENANKLRPWIQGYYVSAHDMREQMDAVTDAGLCGFQVWNANGNYSSVYAALGDWQQPASCK